MNTSSNGRLKFNRNPIKTTGYIEQPSQELVKNTLGLFNASLEDAVKYGGDLTRAALGAVQLHNDRKYVVVDTKVHMLIPGMSPAIPGWHTDGVPRGPKRDNIHHGDPDLYAQEWDSIRPHRYHLLVTGVGCLTEFMDSPNWEMYVPENQDSQIYNKMSEQVNRDIKSGNAKKRSVESCVVTEFDWWDIHQGIPATTKEWRFLMRVMESDFAAPERDLRNVIRTQQQVYAPTNFGW